AQKHNFFLSLFQCMHPVEQLHFLFGAYHDLFRGIPVSNESLVKRMICMLFPFLQLLIPDMLCDLAEPCRYLTVIPHLKRALDGTAESLLSQFLRHICIMTETHQI